MKAMITKEMSIGELLEISASVLNGIYYNLPYWFKKTENGNFEMYFKNEYPDELNKLSEINKRADDADKTTEALEYLESQGFYVHNLWHVQDVQDKFDCTEEEALAVLDDAVSGGWIMEHINDRISEFGDRNNLNRQ